MFYILSSFVNSKGWPGVHASSKGTSWIREINYCVVADATGVAGHLYEYDVMKLLSK
jgi:hypothetical protein